jgi:hypothetical protein
MQAVFALVILCGEVPSGLLSGGRKKTLLLGAGLKAFSFSILPLLSSYEGFLFYHLTMGIALSMISGGDIALLYDSYLATGGEKSRPTAILGNVKLAAQTGTTVSALVGGAVVTLSYGHLLWANAIVGWIPVLLVLCITEPPASFERPKKWAQDLKEVRSATIAHRRRRVADRRVFRDGVFLGWGGILLGILGQVGRGLGGVLFLEVLNERISSAFRATVISLSQLGVRASFFLLGPLVGYGIDTWGLPSVLSALGLLFSIAFVCLLLPLVLRGMALITKEAST